MLKAGVMADAWTASHGELRAPLPVERPRGQLRSWFVPVICGDRLLGFFELSPELVPMRYSSFQRRQGELEDCPEAASWIDPTAIRAKAQKALQPGEVTGEPFLSYDAVPSRLAWAVPITAPGGAERIVYVAAHEAFEGRGERESTGGTA